MSRSTIAVGLTVLVTAGLLLIPRVPTGEEPTRPAAETVLEQVEPGAPARLEHPLEAAAVAQHWVVTARRRGDDSRLVGRAQAVLTPWWNDPDAPPGVRLVRALIHEALLDLPAALIDLEGLDEPAAHRLRARVLRALGRLDEAQAVCVTLGSLECTTSVLALREAPEASARAFAQHLANEPRVAATDFITLGEAFWLAGKPSEAEAALRRALELDPQESTARRLLIDALVAQQRSNELPALLRGHELSDDALLAFVRSGAASALETQALQERLVSLSRRREPASLRVLARAALTFEAPSRALPLAIENFTRHQEPEDVAVLLDAAAAANDAEAAALAVGWLERTRCAAPYLREKVR